MNDGTAVRDGWMMEETKGGEERMVCWRGKRLVSARGHGRRI